MVETHGRVAPSARSATDPAICGLSGSAANNSTKLRRRRLHRMQTNHSRVDRVAFEEPSVASAETEVKHINRVATPLCVDKQSVELVVRESVSRDNDDVVFSCVERVGIREDVSRSKVDIALRVLSV